MDTQIHVPHPSPPVALVRVAALAPVVAFLRRSGAPVERLLSRSRVPATVLGDPEAVLSAWQAFRFMEDAARACGVDDLGLLAGMNVRVDELGFFGRLIRRCATVREAIETAIRAMPAFNSASRYRLVHEGDRVRVAHEFALGLGAGFRQGAQYCSVLPASLLGVAIEPRWPREERVAPDALWSDLRIAVRRDEAGVSFPRSLLNRPLRADPAPRIEEENVQAWTASGPADDFLGSLLQVIAALSSPEYPRISHAADAIGMSVRALQRRLADVGVSYGRLLGFERLTIAVDLLERTDATVLDIALDLGYSDHAHFTRAFRRWTGMGPREFRRVSRGMPGASPRLAAAQAGRPSRRAKRPFVVVSGRVHPMPPIGLQHLVRGSDPLGGRSRPRSAHAMERANAAAPVSCSRSR